VVAPDGAGERDGALVPDAVVVEAQRGKRARLPVVHQVDHPGEVLRTVGSDVVEVQVERLERRRRRRFLALLAPIAPAIAHRDLGRVAPGPLLGRAIGQRGRERLDALVAQRRTPGRGRVPVLVRPHLKIK
jgi:hypothetical protein